MNAQKLYTLIPGLTQDELHFMKQALDDLNDTQLETFAGIYNGRRRTTDMILIGGIIGLLGIAGIQRFMINQIGMGILYLLTGGLCLIGTIVDLVNYKSLAFEYNQAMIVESKNMALAIHS